MTSPSLSGMPWKNLSSEEKRERMLAIEVLRRLRNGEEIDQVLKDTGVTIELVRKHAGQYL